MPGDKKIDNKNGAHINLSSTYKLNPLHICKRNRPKLATH